MDTKRRLNELGGDLFRNLTTSEMQPLARDEDFAARDIAETTVALSDEEVDSISHFKSWVEFSKPLEHSRSRMNCRQTNKWTHR